MYLLQFMTSQWWASYKLSLCIKLRSLRFNSQHVLSWGCGKGVWEVKLKGVHHLNVEELVSLDRNESHSQKNTISWTKRIIFSWPVRKQRSTCIQGVSGRVCQLYGWLPQVFLNKNSSINIGQFRRLRLLCTCAKEYAWTPQLVHNLALVI